MRRQFGCQDIVYSVTLFRAGKILSLYWNSLPFRGGSVVSADSLQTLACIPDNLIAISRRIQALYWDSLLAQQEILSVNWSCEMVLFSNTDCTNTVEWGND